MEAGRRATLAGRQAISGRAPPPAATTASIDISGIEAIFAAIVAAEHCRRYAAFTPAPREARRIRLRFLDIRALDIFRLAPTPPFQGLDYWPISYLHYHY